MTSVHCPYCHGAAKLVTGVTLYPHRTDLLGKKFWHCAPCEAWVGCHPPAGKNGRNGLGDGTVPLGRLANAELRKAKQAAHAAFDPIWKSREMSRTAAYKWLATEIGVQPQNMHIGMLDVDGCNAVINVCKQRSLT